MPDLEKIRTTRKVICIGFALMPLVYVAVAAFIGLSRDPSQEPASNPIFTMALSFVALATCAAAVALKPRLYSVERVRGLSPGDAALKLHMGTIVILAIAECPAIYGLTLYFITRSPAALAGLVLLTYITLALAWPGQDVWDRAMREAESQADSPQT